MRQLGKSDNDEHDGEAAVGDFSGKLTRFLCCRHATDNLESIISMDSYESKVGL